MTQNVFDYMTTLVVRKRKAGRESTADLYRAVCNRLRSFMQGKTLSFIGVTGELVNEFAGRFRRDKQPEYLR